MQTYRQSHVLVHPHPIHAPHHLFGLRPRDNKDFRRPGFIRPQRLHHFLTAHFGCGPHDDHQVEARLPVKHEHRTDRISAFDISIQVIQRKSHGLAQDEILRHDQDTIHLIYILFTRSKIHRKTCQNKCLQEKIAPLCFFNKYPYICTLKFMYKHIQFNQCTL